mmetsp:Transcript_71336/g.125565  ORF Transcript_71336/g.125565 Transcript_71336/m.125565 type:complete len:556 (-) Transcript_71336:1949-3616(-)
MVKETEYLRNSIREFGGKLEELRLCRHAIVNKDSEVQRDHAKFLIQEVGVTAKDIAFRLNILHEGKDRDDLARDFARQEARMNQSIRLLQNAMKKPIKGAGQESMVALEEEELSTAEREQAQLVKMMDPSVALKKVRQMLTDDLQALLELQSMFNVALHEQAGGLDTVEGNLTAAHDNATQGSQQLMAAVRARTSKSAKKGALAAAIVGFCVGGPVGAAVGGTIAASVVSAGAVAVVGGTATAGAMKSWNRMRLRNLEKKDPSLQRRPELLPSGSCSPSSSSSPRSPILYSIKASSSSSNDHTSGSESVAGSFADASRLLQPAKDKEAKRIVAQNGPQSKSSSEVQDRAQLELLDGYQPSTTTTPAGLASKVHHSVADGSLELFTQREQLDRCREKVKQFQEQMEYSDLLLKALGVKAAATARGTASAPKNKSKTEEQQSVQLVELPVPDAHRDKELKERDRLYKEASGELDAIASRIGVAKGEEKARLSHVLTEALHEIGEIEGVLSGIHAQAKAINSELGEQNELLEDLDEQVGLATEKSQQSNSWIARLLKK